MGGETVAPPATVADIVSHLVSACVRSELRDSLNRPPRRARARSVRKAFLAYVPEALGVRRPCGGRRCGCVRRPSERS